MFKITDTMVLALLKKGLLYEAKNVEMEMNVPLSIFGVDEEDCSGRMTLSFKIESYTIKIDQD